MHSALARILRDHETVLAASGVEAKAIIEQDETFCLVLCDMMMSDMSGAALHEWLLVAPVDLGDGILHVVGRHTILPHTGDIAKHRNLD